ncbi:TOTE conflict system archaeo-eukaryotic primase domain-containing protein [Spiribacter halobius]|uniref:Restriction endonuclease subunit R n=1 Tax=Sediminicurvatus halobius TaxID=2182432 RepID=A0A2U2MXK9_9GAMM|nr:DEAD/DEAH box helicase [Spiribacter halobius]PWG61616.1 restriction endonuclease subunit R [Spiribacter halobius]UEX77293.1 DEAD/DEAH box helicase [Spiribacter halobius]
MTDDDDKPEAIRATIAREEERLAALDAERERAREELRRLRLRLAESSANGASASQESAEAAADGPETPAAKLALFRALFRGRQDVYPLRFVSRRTGKAGYSPGCSNKFVPGICGLPKIKCGECPNQAFVPVDDQALLAHLQGRQVMGVYPLLADDTCCFLAVDFDKQSWQEDVIAFRDTCRAAGVPCAVERSQSGDGAHAWFFFERPVPASLARQLGCHLLTLTMSTRRDIALESYDRLFPNQDTRPRGGFGNLIALPLQRRARDQGNTVFLDEHLAPYPDQWRYLASIPRIAPARVEALATEAARKHQVLGVPSGEGGEPREAPWRLPPSGSVKPALDPALLPDTVHAVLAQKLFVRTEGLPSPLISRIRRLAAFQNPEFYSKQRMRLSTALTPRVIARDESHGAYLAIPRGCLTELRTLLGEQHVELVVEDERTSGASVQHAFRGELTAPQRDAADAMLGEEMGVVVAPPGFGKTVLGAFLAAKRGCSTLVLVHRKPLMEQWVARLALFLGIAEKEVGRIGGGRQRATGRLDVAMIQSLVRKGEVSDLVAGYGQVIVDECHHLPAFSFERVLAEVKARYVVGLTATPTRRDGHHPILTMQLGPPRFIADARTQAAQRAFRHRLIVRRTRFTLPDPVQDRPIQQIYGALAESEDRNAQVVDDILSALEAGRSPLVLTERRDHLIRLAERLRGFVRHLVTFHGGMGVRQRRETRDRLAAIAEDEERLILATGRYVGEGFDDRRLDTLFLAMPIAWKGTVTQYAGRLHRLNGGKREVRIYDYVDVEVPMLARMFDKRLAAYRALGYERDEDAGSDQQLPLEPEPNE